MSPDSSARSQVADVQAHVRIAGHRVALVPKAPFVLTPTDEGVEVVHRGMLARLRVVGDSLRDLQAAMAVGAMPVLVLTGKGTRTLENNMGLEENIAVYDDLATFVENLLEEGKEA